MPTYAEPQPTDATASRFETVAGPKRPASAPQPRAARLPAPEPLASSAPPAPWAPVAPPVPPIPYAG